MDIRDSKYECNIFPFFLIKIVLKFLNFIARNRMICQYLFWNSISKVKGVIITFHFCIITLAICRLKNAIADCVQVFNVGYCSV